MNGNFKKEEKRPLFAIDVETMTNLYSVAGKKKKLVTIYYYRNRI